MTVDKAIHYINNKFIVDAINISNEIQLHQWLKDMAQHILIMGYSENNLPIELIAERYLINLRLN